MRPPNLAHFAPFVGWMAESASALAKASGDALLLFVPVASDASASSVARDLRPKAAIGAVKRGRIAELIHLTRDELCDLAGRIKHNLFDLEAGSVERFNALTILENIRRVMVLWDFHR
jgi:hypothetical protein